VHGLNKIAPRHFGCKNVINNERHIWQDMEMRNLKYKFMFVV
jgi:hypothetical protein